MKVRIVKCTDINWYKDQIGCLFNVVDSIKHKEYYDFKGDFGPTYHLLKSDCEILPEENKPEPFDLDRALKGEKVVLGDGKTLVTDIYLSLIAKKVVGIVNGIPYLWDKSGEYFQSSDHIVMKNANLFMAPRESEYVTKWVNVYQSESGYIYIGSLFDTKDDALRCGTRSNGDTAFDTTQLTFKLPS